MLNRIRDPTSVDSKLQEDVLTPTPTARCRGCPLEDPKYLKTHCIEQLGLFRHKWI